MDFLRRGKEEPKTENGNVDSERQDPDRPVVPTVQENKFVGVGTDYRCKLIGIVDVDSIRGDQMCHMAMASAVNAWKLSKTHKQKFVLNISTRGLTLMDPATKRRSSFGEQDKSVQHVHDVKRISFISQDPTDDRAFGYIYNPSDDVHKFVALKTAGVAKACVVDIWELFNYLFVKGGRKAGDEGNEADATDKKEDTTPNGTTEQNDEKTTEGEKPSDDVKPATEEAAKSVAPSSEEKPPEPAPPPAQSNALVDLESIFNSVTLTGTSASQVSSAPQNGDQFSALAQDRTAGGAADQNQSSVFNDPFFSQDSSTKNAPDKFSAFNALQPPPHAVMQQPAPPQAQAAPPPAAAAAVFAMPPQHSPSPVMMMHQTPQQQMFPAPPVMHHQQPFGGAAQQGFPMQQQHPAQIGAPQPFAPVHPAHGGVVSSPAAPTTNPFGAPTSPFNQAPPAKPLTPIISATANPFAQPQHAAPGQVLGGTGLPNVQPGLFSDLVEPFSSAGMKKEEFFADTKTKPKPVLNELKAQTTATGNNNKGEPSADPAGGLL